MGDASRFILIVALLGAAACRSDGDGRLAEAPLAQTRAATGIRYLAGTGNNGPENGVADGDRAGEVPFRRATEIRRFRFPEDHGPHQDYRTEWWYFTGNLQSDAGRHFGFELTFFRLGLVAGTGTGGEDWGRDSAWMAHFALTDTANGGFAQAERLARSHERLAFARSDALTVRVQDWSANTGADGNLHLQAQMEGYSIDLNASGLEEIVLQGEQGLDRKGPEIGNASYYYSAPSLQVTGVVATGGNGTGAANSQMHRVSGSAWLDREWGTSTLSPGVAGWDWFALQLSDGRRLMYYRLRTSGGDTSPYSGGSLAGPGQAVVRLGTEDVRLDSVRTWRSEATGVRYPVAWSLSIPGESLALEIEPVLEAQEIDLSVRYWEGAVQVRGVANGLPIDGQGYLELAGYE